MTTNLLKTNNFESILINKAQGSWVWDIDGKKYLDCESGMWCCNLGHNHPKVVQVMKNQLSEILHRNNRFLTPITLEAADRVLKFFPGDYDRLTFLNSGSEAMEFAINFTKKITGRDKVLSLHDSFLGSYGTAKASSYTTGTESRLKIPYQMCNSSNCDCRVKYTAILEEVFQNNSQVPACFVLEPIMVSGGVYKPCTNLIQYICQKTHDEGGLIVVDEVTTGLGRAGHKFGYEHFGIIPDVIAIGKALGNGYPISAIITTSLLESKVSPSDMYYAQSHQLDPLGAAVAKAVVDVIEEEQVIEECQSKLRRINNYLTSFSHPCIKEVRSYGMIFGIQIQSYNHHSSKEMVVKLKDELMKAGIMIGFNLQRDILRLLPPLNITDEEIAFLIQKITHAFETF